MVGSRSFESYPSGHKEYVDEKAMSPEEQRATARATALQYAWNWFQYHAGQRMLVFRFFLVLTGALAAGCFAFLQKQNYDLLLVLAILTIAFCFLFWRLDCRNRTLVKIAETYLKDEEEWLSTVLGLEHIRLAHRADLRRQPKPTPPVFLRSTYQYIEPIFDACFASFAQINQWIFCLIGGSGFALFIYSLAYILSSRACT